MEREDSKNNYTLFNRVRLLTLKLKRKDRWERVKKRKIYGNGTFREATGKSLEEHLIDPPML